MIDRKCNEATTALGVMPEPRLLLTAALLIADELAELKNGVAAPAPDEHGETRRLERIAGRIRSEEHTSELQSLMRISYAVFCLKKKDMNKYKANNKPFTTDRKTSNT